MAPFPHSAHRIGQADFPHPALGQDFTLSRATPSAASEHLLELIGFSISRSFHVRSFTTYCVCLELRSPSLHRRYPASAVRRTSSATPGRPACPSRASGWSSLTTPWGFPCFVRFPCVHAAANTPAQRLNVSLRSFHPDVSVFPDRVVGSACALSFSRIARRSLALRPVHWKAPPCTAHATSRHLSKQFTIRRQPFTPLRAPAGSLRIL
jgi:hypothetical protein